MLQVSFGNILNPKLLQMQCHWCECSLHFLKLDSTTAVPPVYESINVTNSNCFECKCKVESVICEVLYKCMSICGTGLSESH